MEKLVGYTDTKVEAVKRQIYWQRRGHTVRIKKEYGGYSVLSKGKGGKK